MILANPEPYTIAVRALCEFTAKVGDLDLRFTPAPTAKEGIAGHARVAASRGTGYQAELKLEGLYRGLRVRGRADGYDATRHRLEEIKTYKGRLDAMPNNHQALHWAQVKVYGALLCAAENLADIELALVYFDIGSQQETVLCERHDARSLRTFFELQCERFLAWAEQEVAHRATRDAALLELAFVHAEFRAGQRPLAQAAYNAARSGRCLLAQAPTGIGKTVGTLFPLLKACPGQRIDKIFYLSAKTSGRALALDALDLIGRSRGAPKLRSLELMARDKACVHPDKACHGDSCPLARGFYDRLPQARATALATTQSGLIEVQKVAAEHEVCPYYLAQELVRWSDVIVGDYNYFFDVTALLYGLTQAQQWRVALLIDEAHNLVERGRSMYTAELSPLSLRAAKRSDVAQLKKPLARLHRAWNELSKDQQSPYEAQAKLPEKWFNALQNANAAITAFYSENPTHIDADLQRFYFDSLHFARMAELFDAHSLFDVSLNQTPGGKSKPQAMLCIRNVVPAPFLAPRFAAAHCAVLFSATLQPQRYYRTLLGLPETTAWLDVEGPFEPDQLKVSIARNLSTRYQDRKASLQPLVDLMAKQYQALPGNYLAFFSSYDYLQDAVQALAQRHAQIPMWTQERGMSESAQQAFLARFTRDGQGIAFAVLGGAFSEGIDLPGTRLVGAFIATLGLPQVNPVNEQIKQRLQDLFGAGYDYTYIYPGLQKVVQAAGRVIRTATDVGVVHLMDDRYARRELQALLPSWWHID